MSNPSTLITRFYGLYSIKPHKNKSQTVRFIVMNNVFDTPFKIDSRYDLKGSTVGREADEKELKRETPILKDLDILKQKKKIIVGAEQKKLILAQLKSDTEWLAQNSIMDYSLLLGEHKCEKTDEGDIIEDGILAYSKLLEENDNFYEENKVSELEKVKETITNKSGVDIKIAQKLIEDSILEKSSPRLKSTRGSKTNLMDSKETFVNNDSKGKLKDEKVKIEKLEEKSSPLKIEIVKSEPSPKKELIIKNENVDFVFTIEKEKDEKKETKNGQNLKEPTKDLLETIQKDDRRPSLAQMLDIKIPEGIEEKIRFHEKKHDEDDESSNSDSALTLSPRPSDGDTLKPTNMGVRNSMFNILNPLSNRLSIMFTKKEDLTILKSIGPNRISDFQRVHGGLLSKSLDEKGRKEIYFLGIIDLLQKWNSKKQVENLFKGLTKDRSQISAVEPKAYAKRFYEFVEKLLE